VFTDFWPNGMIGAGGDPSIFGSQNSGGSAGALHSAVSGTCGILKCETLTGTTGRGAVDSFHVAQGPRYDDGVTTLEWRIRVPVLSDATDRFTVMVNLGTGTAFPGNAQVGFYYRDDLNGGKWLAASRNSAIETTADTGVAVVAGTWYALRAVCNAGGTSVSFFVNGAAAGTITTNIPAAGSTAYGLAIIKSAGTTSREVHADWFWVEKLFTTAR
jgi:hypothetical protein